MYALYAGGVPGRARGRFRKRAVALATLIVLAGTGAAAGLRIDDVGDTGNLASMLPEFEIPKVSEIIKPRTAAPVHRDASFRISGPASAGLAVLVNDTPALRARARAARLEHASRLYNDDASSQAENVAELVLPEATVTPTRVSLD